MTFNMIKQRDRFLLVKSFIGCLGRCLVLSMLGLAGTGTVNGLTSIALANEPASLDRLIRGLPNHATEPDFAELDATESAVTAPAVTAPAVTAPAVTGLDEAETIDMNAGDINTAASVLQQAADQAMQAEQLATTADSAADWDRVMVQWLGVIALAQSIPPDSPSRIVAQRQLRSYVQRLQEVQRRAEQASLSSGLPSLGSDVFDAQLAGYLSYVATVGTPDILIVGSSRALQGIDPQVMQQRLIDQGYNDLKVFNFSVNGATAQVANFVLSELLPELLPQPLPPVIIWGDGSRAFNDGKRDRTWEHLVTSPGYQAIHRGTLSTMLSGGRIAVSPSENLSAIARPTHRVTAHSPLSDIPGSLDALGFSAVGDRFTPQTYYQQFPRVRGRYDEAYASFSLNGPQTNALAQLAAFSAEQNSQLIFVNLPLSDSYLDADRLYYESQFQQFLQRQSHAHSFEVIDLLTQWRGQSALFADPSHINQEGAAVIATQLARNPTIRAAIYTQKQLREHQADSSNHRQQAIHY